MLLTRANLEIWRKRLLGNYSEIICYNSIPTHAPVCDPISAETRTWLSLWLQIPWHLTAPRHQQAGCTSLVPHLIGPPSHWSPISLVPHLIGPPSHWSPKWHPCTNHFIGPPSHWSPRLIGPPSHWSPISLVPFSLVPQLISPPLHYLNSLVPLLIGPPINKSPTTLFEPIGPPSHWSPFH